MSSSKVVLITAGSAGLGAQIARAFAPDFRVVINYANNDERASTLLKELESIPSTTTHPVDTPRFYVIKADIGDKPSVQHLAKETLTTMKRLDVVVSNHGWTRVRDFLNFSEGTLEEDWDKCFIYNVKSHLWLMEAAKNALEDSEGAFISTASLAGVKPSGSSLPYSVTKAAQIHLVKGLALICGPKIRVNSVSPGLLLTEWGMQFAPEKRDKALEATKLKRLPTVEDVADQVRTFALSRSITGQNIVIDSGTSV
ncbi:NAD(P)-binding protein [Tothia fuscella]|uniref:NAD(P)-binding protein n=1 Tax=Tothia fuscella TaxID=1048955 RepID=A0A9P4P3R6_9PEZI|nr:NAD(P)-binding protein [Tothia fuscella]